MVSLQYRRISEMIGFLRSMEKQGHENDRSFYLEGWEGNGSYRYDRIARGSLFAEAICISMLGGITPGPLAAYLRDAFKGSGDDGLMQRFQLAVFPDIKNEWQNIDREPISEAQKCAFEVVEKLNGLDPNALGAERASDGRWYLRLTPEAQQRFDVWRERLERRIRSREDHPVFVGHLSKYRSLVPSLALIFHLIDCVTHVLNLVPSLFVRSIKQSKWSEYLESHAGRIYQSVTGRSRFTAAELAKKIKSGKLENGFTARTIYSKGWAGLTEPHDVSEALDLLEELHWLRGEEGKRSASSGGRPSTKYQINPKVFLG